MAGIIKIGPYKPLGVSTQAVPGGGYLNIDASAGNFGPSPLARLGLQAAQGAAGIAGVVAEQLAGDNEATVKLADTRMGETEQALLFDPPNGFLNLQGQDALTQAPAVLDTYREAQLREMATLTDDDQRRMFAELADRRLATFSTQVDRHATAERQRWYDATSEHRIALMQADAALHWNDDALLRRSLGTARAEVRDQAERKGWDSALTEAALHHQTSRTLVSAIEAAVDRDPRRAQALRARYAAALEGHHRVALDALLAEAQTRERAQAASTEILNATPPDGEQSTPHWRLRQAEAIAEPAVRAATIRRLASAAAADEARARTLGEQVLTRVLKDGLTDPSQIPVGEWVTLDAEHRQAIETRLDHNADGTEPAPNPVLVDELALQMVAAPYDFERRDLVPLIARLSLRQWQRFRDWQAGLRRNDLTTVEELYAVKRGLQIARGKAPADTSDERATNFRAELVEEIDTWRRIYGKSPDDVDITGMLQRRITPAVFIPRTLGGDPLQRPEIHLVQNRGKPSGPVAPPRPPSLEVSPLEERMKAVTVPILPPLGSVPGRAIPSPAKSGPASSKTPSAPGPSSAPTPTQRAPGAPPPTGSAAGRAIGGASSGDTRRSLPGPNALNKSAGRSNRSSPPSDSQRHHEVVQATWRRRRKKPIIFSPEARQFFDEKIIRVMKGDHKYNDDHRQYNKLVRAAMEKYLAEHPKIDPLKMNRADAEELYKAAVLNNPEVRDFRAKMAISNQKFMDRYPDWREGQ